MSNVALTGIIYVAVVIVWFGFGYILGRKKGVKDVGVIKIYPDEEGNDYLMLELSKDMRELKTSKKVVVRVETRE